LAEGPTTCKGGARPGSHTAVAISSAALALAISRSGTAQTDSFICNRLILRLTFL